MLFTKNANAFSRSPRSVFFPTKQVIRWWSPPPPDDDIHVLQIDILQERLHGKKAYPIRRLGKSFRMGLTNLFVMPFRLQPQSLLAEQLTEHQLIIPVAGIQPNRLVQRLCVRSGAPTAYPSTYTISPSRSEPVRGSGPRLIPHETLPRSFLQ